MELDREALEIAAKALAGGDWRTPPWTMLNTDKLNNGYRYDAEVVIRAYLTHAKQNEAQGSAEVIWATHCATEGCERPAVKHFDSGGIGSYYCETCMAKISATLSQPEGTGQ